MGNRKQTTHFGLNCRNLRRDKCSPADYRCASVIANYAGAEFSFIETKTPVSLEAASRLTGIPEPDLVHRAKTGEFEWFFPENVAKRVKVDNKRGEPKSVTVGEAAKILKISIADLEERIAAGEIKADYPEKKIRIFLVNRWEYEKCPLIETGGLCRSFQPHAGPQITCIADAPTAGNLE
jgi:hypothetical protein